ncbi:hypothetical protein MRB53_033220 [Persea americana]|uniref:Uncharacterized protein n=1 Tax=Persea americana TaxID=3435 RepID=A0ACC2KU65_PERAE|nr:hypothetical protein MRB53_033220 [Persea americana]
MESFKTQISSSNLFSSLTLLFLSSSLLLFLPTTQAITPPAGTIERTTKQQILASLPPTTHEPAPSSELFLTSPSGKYEAYLLRRVTSPGAGGFGNDFCYLQIQESGHNVWESECAVVSNVNTCTLVFSDAGLEIFDGSRSTWDTDADGDQLETLVLLDSGDMQIREHEGDLAWRASDNPIVNQECGSVGSPGLSPAHPPFASPVPGRDINFGQPLGGSQQQQQSSLGSSLGYQQQPSLGSQQQQQPLGQQPSLGGVGLNQPFGVNSNALVDNTPFDSGSERKMEITCMVVGVALAFLGFLF